jgi:hypothetical protein
MCSRFYHGRKWVFSNYSGCPLDNSPDANCSHRSSRRYTGQCYCLLAGTTSSGPRQRCPHWHSIDYSDEAISSRLAFGRTAIQTTFSMSRTQTTQEPRRTIPTGVVRKRTDWPQRTLGRRSSITWIITCDERRFAH